MVLQVAADAREALLRLAGVHGLSRFLLDIASAGPALLALTEMTCGEVDSGVDVITLGESWPGVQSLPRPDPDMLQQALANPEPHPCEWNGDPPLRADQIMRMMQDGNVQVRFQPIVNIRDRSVVALEVLARLHQTTCSILPPHRFVPQLEQAGLGADLLRHVAEAALSVMPSLGDSRLALNLPLTLLNERRTIDMLATLREQAGVPAFRILIELTETEVVHDPHLLDPVIERWRNAGYTLAIDDAGPDVPHHRAMFRLPFDWVKLDKSVVAGAMATPGARREAADTVARAHRAGLLVVAEGIENQETWDGMRDLGVDCAQGFMIARPLPASVVPVWRAAWTAGGSQFPS